MKKEINAGPKKTKTGMMDKINLSNVIGIGGGEGQSPFLDCALDLGFRSFRVDGADWGRANREKGVYNLEHFRQVVEKVYSRGGEVFPAMFSIPAWTDPTQPKVDGWIGFDAIAGFKPELHSSLMLNYFDYFCRLFPNPLCKTVLIPTETNIARVWRDLENPRKPRSAADYMELVIKPATKIFHFHNKKVVAGAPTLRGQDSRDFAEALEHFRQFREANDKDVNADFLDIHVYHDKGGQAGTNIGKDIDRFFLHFAYKEKPIKHPIFITETGCNESSAFSWFERFWRNLFGKENYTGEQNQERNYKALLSYIQSDQMNDDPDLKKVFFFEMFDPPDRKKDFNGLLRFANDDDDPKTVFTYPAGKVHAKRAALLIREYLEA